MNNRGEKRSLKFLTDLPILDSSCCAASKAWVSTVYDVLLDPDQLNTELIPVSQAIAPGEVDHFVLRLAATKSSQFDLNVKLRKADGTVVSSHQVDIEIFSPSGSSIISRAYAKQIEAKY